MRRGRQEAQVTGEAAGTGPGAGVADAGADRIVLAAGSGVDAVIVEIAKLGAELRRWTVGGRELLWSGDPVLWDGVAPVLFPVCGWTRHGEIRVGGRTYALGLHGFARHHRFAAVEVTATSATLVLTDTPETRAAYPFPFRFAVRYTLAARDLAPHALIAELTVVNTGPAPMPYAAGLHPGFLHPPRIAGSAAGASVAGEGGDVGDGAIVFDAAERRSVPVIAPGGLFSARRRRIAFDGRTLPLQEETFAREALCFLHARSRGLNLVPAEPGRGGLRIAFEALPHIVLWSRPGAPFVCVEGWSGWGDPENYAGELVDKPGMILLPPGEARRHAMRMSFDPGPADAA